MSITPHPVADYKAALFVQIRNSEGFGLRNRPGLPYLDTATPPRATIGYGFNIENGNAARLVLARLGLFAGKTDADVLRIESEFRTAIRAGHGSHSALEASLDAFAVRHGVAGGKFRLSETQGEAIFNQILTGVPAGVLTGIGGSTINVEGKQERLNANINNTFNPTTGWSTLDINSKEYEALMSLFYNTESLIAKGSNLANAVIQGERVEAWYEIRYRSNLDEQHAARRYAESDLFGQYDGVNGQFPATELEARQVLNYLHQDNITENILRYEGQFKLPQVGAGGLDRYTQPAEGLLIVAFAAPLGITVANVFAANPNGVPGDPLVGSADSDLLLGASGHDILIGGGGNDLLRGEAGKDLYIINAGDGNDTIVDTAADLNGDGQPDGDGLGVVVFDHQMLQGGLKQQNESVYTSLDGQVTYQRSGADLVVNGTLTIKGWQEGQFGIRLKDLPNDPEDPGVGDVGGGGGRTLFQRIDHYIQVGNQPDGTPILEPVYVPLFDENANDSANASPSIGDEANTIVALGGNDVVVTGAGPDSIDGGEGDDVLFGKDKNAWHAWEPAPDTVSLLV